MHIHCGINRYAVILGIKGLAYCMDKEMHTTDIKFVGLIIDYNISCVSNYCYNKVYYNI